MTTSLNQWILKKEILGNHPKEDVAKGVKLADY